MAEAEAIDVDLEIIVQGAHGRSKPELRLWLRMLSTTKMISQEIRRRLRAEFGATLPQFDLMAQLYREKDGLRLGEALQAHHGHQRQCHRARREARSRWLRPAGDAAG
ncbi:hypothetical protein LZK73_23630 [Neorhizobium galegae]|nr:hypothetical protein LZK73_23630 [Neorhizobium galegae]